MHLGWHGEYMHKGICIGAAAACRPKALEGGGMLFQPAFAKLPKEGLT